LNKYPNEYEVFRIATSQSYKQKEV